MAEIWLRDIYLPPFVEDQDILTLDPLATTFKNWETQLTVLSRSEENRRRRELLDSLKTDSWLIRINNWLSLVLGGHVPDDARLDAQIELFVDVMWSRFLYKDSSQCRSEVVRLLGPARKALGVRPYNSTLGPEFTLVGDLDAYDIPALTPSEYPNLRALIFGDESDLSDLSEDESDNENDVRMPLAATGSKATVHSNVDSGAGDGRRNVCMNMAHGLDNRDQEMPAVVDSGSSACRDVGSHSFFEEHGRRVRAFFFPTTENGSQRRSCKMLVDALVELRNVEEGVFTRAAFRTTFQRSSLYKLLLRVCDPFHPLENSHPDVQQSFRLYNWKSAYGEILDRWSPLHPSVPLPPLIEQGSFSFDADHFLRFFGSHVEIHPWVAYPFSCTFLTTGWDLKKVYCSICKHPVMEEGNDTRQVRRLLKVIDARFATVLLETRRYKSTLKSVNTEIFEKCNGWSPSSPPAAADRHDGVNADPTVADPSASTLPSWYSETGCRACSDRSESEKCVRFVPVKDHSDSMAKYVDYALTVYGESERLQPKDKGRKHKLGPQKYVDPREIGMQEITPRPKDHPVWSTCNRDIVRLVYTDPDTNKAYLVGGFRYNSFSQSTLELLHYNSHLIKTTALRRRAAMQRWDYGEMSGEGSRMPAGGRKGDGYMPYNIHRGDTVDDIKAFFRSALDNDLLIIAAKSIYQGIESDFKSLTNDASLYRLGKYGLTSYYCENYIAPVHQDLDIEAENRRYLHPCMQLAKEGCSTDDFNFAYVHWGVYFRTESNAVW
ncbi:hypothetical protein R3P38DRAFT_3217804 [Favolaschia claudopus]|uniref:Uncharacterized protein n=1 Tax=Favolaschia claudopus TaxID=2862362 RepID=A0AAW0A497_9AGAR